jgi:hypothetical protein
MPGAAETEVALMDIQNMQRRVSSIGPGFHNILLRKLPGEVLEKFQIFSERIAGYTTLQLWGRRLTACSCRQLADNTHQLSGGVPVRQDGFG